MEWLFAEEIHVNSVVLMMYKVLYCVILKNRRLNLKNYSIPQIRSTQITQATVSCLPNVRTNSDKKAFQYEGPASVEYRAAFPSDKRMQKCTSIV